MGKQSTHLVPACLPRHAVRLRVDKSLMTHASSTISLLALSLAHATPFGGGVARELRLAPHHRRRSVFYKVYIFRFYKTIINFLLWIIQALRATGGDRLYVLHKPSCLLFLPRHRFLARDHPAHTTFQLRPCPGPLHSPLLLALNCPSPVFFFGPRGCRSLQSSSQQRCLVTFAFAVAM